MQTQKIDFHKQRDFGNKLNATIEFIKRNFKPLVKSMLYIAGPFLLLGSIFMSSVFSYSFRNAGNVNDDPLAMYTENLLNTLGGMVFLILASAALIAVVYEYLKLYEKNESETITVDQVFQKVKSSFWNVLGTMFLYGLLIALVYLALIIPMITFSFLGVGVIIFLVFVIIFGLIYFLIGSSFVFIIRSYENVGFLTALSRSFKLVKGKWWSTFGLLFVIGLIQGMVSGIFMMPYYIQTVAATMHTINTGVFEEPSITSQIINHISLFLYFTLSYLMYALPLIGLAFQYFNLREMKEASGLINKIDSFEALSSDSKDEEHY